VVAETLYSLIERLMGHETYRQNSPARSCATMGCVKAGEPVMPVRAAIIPSIRYENAPAAIDFLVRAFGFERHAVHADPADPSIIHHAPLVWQNQMIMLGSPRHDPRYCWRLAREAGGVTTSLYLVVDDPDAHHARAAAAGAEIVGPPHDNEGYPGRGYEARDPEGNAWSFGSYDPWEGGA
jgi:uncharacterized glyoxalase superfamily protein PhnB